MASFHEYMIEYKKQLQKGTIKAAYKGLMDYFMGLRTYFVPVQRLGQREAFWMQ